MTTIIGRRRRTTDRPALPRRRREVPHEGLQVGLTGAAAVWGWLLGSDLLNGTPFSTPTLLGWWIAASFGYGTMAQWADVLVFTVFLLLAWCAIGAGLAAAVRVAPRHPAIVVFAILVTIFLQFAAVVVTEMLSMSGMGRMAWRDVLLGELVGMVAAAILLLRRHPELPDEFRAGSLQ